MFKDLTAHDRCDTKDCGAQAYVRVTFKESDLLFCGHHFNAVENVIRVIADVDIQDEREKIGSNRLDVSA